jgi:signal transduction histidine kinase
MKLRTQTGIIVAVISLIVFILLHLTAVVIIMPGFTSVDQENSNQNLEQAKSVIRYRISQLEQTSRDYGWWDDTYNYAKTPNNEYIESNFADSTFANLNLDSVAILDKNNNLLFFKHFCAHENGWTTAEIDQFIINCQTHTLEAQNSTISGLLLINNQPLMLAITPILTSSNEGPLSGWIVFGSHLGQEEVNVLETISDLDFCIRTMDSFKQENSQTAETMLLNPSANVLEINNTTTMSGYAVLEDMDANPVFVLQINHQRVAYQQGAWVENIFIACSVLIAVTFGAGTLVILERKIINPMNKLAFSVKELPFELEKTEKSRFGADELLILSSAVKDSLNKKMDAMLEVSRMVAHDLRNPLSGIKNANYVLKKNYRPVLDSRGNLMLDTIDDCVDYSDKIVKDLLEYASKIKMDKVMASVRGLINRSLEAFVISENVEIRNEVSEEVLAVVDPLKMQRVFTNLISNALDAMPNGGVIVISSRREGKGIVVEFSDNGQGMSEETLKKLGLPFFTTKAKGMGIGLPIVKRVIDAHGGRLEVKSVIGKGTTFSIHLP